MNLQYTDVTGYKTVIDLTKSREQYWIDNAPGIYGKRALNKKIDFRSFTIGEVHAVRNILEMMKTDNFDDVVRKYRELYPHAHPDWQSALEIGLVVKAKDRDHTEAPYYFNDPLAVMLREQGINFFNFDSLIINTVTQSQI